MKMNKGLGAFEYMMSYGWAVLVIVVLAVVLVNLGIFNPPPATQASGFSVIKPVDWKFQSSGYGGSNSPYNTTATITLSNIAGVNLTLAVNGTKDENTSAIRFSKSGAQYCGWYGSVTVVDELGASIDVTTSVGPKGGDIGSVSIPAGKRIIINGQITGPAKDTSFACGGPSNGAYTWNVTYQTAQDKNNIQYKDSGTITGQYQ